ncbi:MAG: aconitate hydratase AcnA [Candidatus Marsarchaeota archaeon]|nr:aconitate hydratase AcnA [Candidatus Marsarchaeota archaeon]
MENGNESYISKFSLSTGKEVNYYSLPLLEKSGMGSVSRLPFSIRVVLESLLRNVDGKGVTMEDVKALAEWNAKNPSDRDVPFMVSRILMQDFTGVPAVVDLAAMRQYVVDHGMPPDTIQPQINVDLIIDHSVQIDAFNTIQAIEINQEKEMERNKERYKFLKWASSAFNDFKVFPPSAGICHQVNLEYLATCVSLKQKGGSYVAFPDTLVGTDSHTTMINGLGIVGFGVGGIEAEAALLNQPVSFSTPKVVGVKLTGKLGEGVTATDFALTLTRVLRDHGVVSAFVEFFGDGLKNLSLPDRATLSNMCPEYGATIAIFPPDEETLRYMKSTGRSDEQVELVKKYYEAQESFNIDYSKVEFSDVIEVDLGSIIPSVSGPSQPKQQIPLGAIKEEFTKLFLEQNAKLKADEKISSDDYTRWSSESEAPENGAIKDAVVSNDGIKHVKIKYDDGHEEILSDGDVVISSITSCTNTSNPSVMIAAGLLARNALNKGLKVNTRKVKTSFGPGSRVVTEYMKAANLMEPLEKLGYELVGYGCTTCIGNSGPLIEKQSDAINAHNIAVASVLSGNRNFEARIHRDVRANYLMSPPLLIAFGIAGTVMKDLTMEPLGTGSDGKPVFLKDIWPSNEEIAKTVHDAIKVEMFNKEYGANIYDVNPYWNKLESPTGKNYRWEEDSTYIRLPPFFDSLENENNKISSINNAAVLAVFGDSISTDHISPAGAIGKDSPAGRYLIEKGINPQDFNTYGSRRGNHEVMMRGTFANNRIKNTLMNGKEGGYTIYFPENKEMAIYDAAMKYKESKTPLVVLALSEYGSGSSRDWAAKGPALIGVKAVVAKSFERIHRSNLIGMGIIPLEFKQGEDYNTLGIDYSKPLSIELPEDMQPRAEITLKFTSKKSGKEETAKLKSRIDTPIELEYYKSGGILNYVLQRISKN